MDFGNVHRGADRLAVDAASGLAEPESMARWRWRLFAIMARFEAGEDVYLRIPNAKLTRCDVSIPGVGGNLAGRILRWLGKKSGPGVKIP